MRNVKLYVGNYEVDLDDNFNINFTYQTEDTNNPSIVKNYFSKTIKILSTPNNDKIFGDIYKLDRKQLLNADNIANATFNPFTRTDFKLYIGSQLQESGYLQLNNININNNQIEYECTLFGQLGSFLYTLMYNEDGEKLKLSNLKFDEDFNFIIDKDKVKDCWNALEENNTNLTFIPSYNGKHEDFSNDKVIINLSSSAIYGEYNKTFEIDGNRYSPYQYSYMLGELEKEYSEYEIGDLRSYMQRPAIKLKKVITTICNEENNGGYKVNLDENFFNENNPYWEDAWLALPMLISQKAETEETNIPSSPLKDATSSKYSWMNNKIGTNEYNRVNSFGLVPFSSSGSTHTTIDVTSNGYTSPIIQMKDGKVENIKTTIDFKLKFKPRTTCNHNSLYMSYVPKGSISENYVANVILITTTIADADGRFNIGQSNGFLFTNKIVSGFIPPFFPTTLKDYHGDEPTESYAIPADCENIDGLFYRESDGTYTFKTADNKQIFRMIAEAPFRQNIAITTTLAWDGRKKRYYLSPTDIFTEVQEYYDGEIWIEVQDTSTFKPQGTLYQLRSGIEITKEQLLKTEYSPADVLLDYCKIFGLHFIQSTGKKEISIVTRNTFYNRNLVNLEDKIDFGGKIKITPNLSTTKFLRMSYPESSTYFEEKYKKQYNLSYGQKTIDTNYNFNKETTQMFNDSIFENVINVLDSSSRYRSFYSSDGTEYPAFDIDGITLKMPKIDNAEEQTELENITLPPLTAVDWNNRVSGFDCFDKPCFFDSEKNLSDVGASLLFYNGFKPLVNKQGKQIRMFLTDDTASMFALNNGDRCYLYTEDEYDELGYRIAYRVNSLPHFSRYKTSSIANSVEDSLDFAVPKENYLATDISYTSDKTIYDRFWGRYVSDRYNINTKKLNAKVNLNDFNVNNEMLRSFYWFKNSMWVINKITNFNPLSDALTEVEFIKVNNISNYYNGQFTTLKEKLDTINLSEIYLKQASNSGGLLPPVIPIGES